MNRFSIMVAVVLASSATRAGDMPYSPSGEVPDYVATLKVQVPQNPAFSSVEVVKHHGGWVRIEGPTGASPGIPVAQTSLANPSKQISVSFTGDFSSVSIERATPASYERVRGTIETGQVETHAGEKCEVREILRRDWGIRNARTQWLSCLTADGIEIATRVFAMGMPFRSTTLVNLERRPVPAKEVEPPANLLDLAQWRETGGQPPQAVDAAKPVPDFAMHMRWQGAVRVLRQHGPWAYDETSYPDGRRNLKIRNYQTGQELFFKAAKGGFFERLSLCQKCPAGDEMSVGPRRKVQPQSMGETDIVLGEPCEWFDMAPGTADVDFLQCLSSDGIPLKIQNGGAWGPREEFVADEVQRRSIKMEEMLPPGDILKRSSWGFPE